MFLIVTAIIYRRDVQNMSTLAMVRTVGITTIKKINMTAMTVVVVIIVFSVVHYPI